MKLYKRHHLHSLAQLTILWYNCDVYNIFQFNFCKYLCFICAYYDTLRISAKLQQCLIFNSQLFRQHPKRENVSGIWTFFQVIVPLSSFVKVGLGLDSKCQKSSIGCCGVQYNSLVFGSICRYSKSLICKEF